MRIVYLSPHLDDAIFSCGGIIAHQVEKGNDVEVWSIFTADPPTDKLTTFAKILHKRWGKQGSPYELRRLEDEEACRFLGVKSRHFNFPDCIYRYYDSDRSPLVRKTSDLFKPVREPEKYLEDRIQSGVISNLLTYDLVILPLGAGGHIDHKLICQLGKSLKNEKTFYPDFPYSGKLDSIEGLNLPADASATRFDLDIQKIEHWKKAAGLYQSQISSFWKSTDALYNAIERYAVSRISCTLWEIPELA
jgi:LmbE family N-acetylglucosaminyl deacetylase